MTGEEWGMGLAAIVLLFSTSVLAIDLIIPDPKDTDKDNKLDEILTPRKDWY